MKIAAPLSDFPQSSPFNKVSAQRFISYEAEVRACAPAAEALRTLEEWLPDALVSDIGMPGKDGYELMRKV